MCTFILRRSLQYCILSVGSLMLDCGVYVCYLFFSFVHGLNVVDLSTLRIVARVDVSIWSLVCLSLGWAGWVLTNAIVPSVSWVLIEDSRVGHRDEICIIVVVTPLVVSVAPSLIVAPIVRWGSNFIPLVG